MAEFDKLDPKSPQLLAEDVVSVYSKGAVRFGNKAAEEYLGDCDNVDVITYKEEGNIGITPNPDGDYMLTGTHDQTVTIRAALIAIGVDVKKLDETIRIVVDYDPSDDMVIIDCDPLFEATEG